jgi:EmrB/QacA subfamily drug resistance transporter
MFVELGYPIENATVFNAASRAPRTDGSEAVRTEIPVSDAARVTSTTPAQGQARRDSHPGLLLLLIAGAQLMVVLDATIVNIALPSMGHHFHKNQTDMTWAINAYTLAFGGLLLLGGRAADILGRRQMFILGLGLFSAGSFLGGVAANFPMLLGGRIIQGIGGAIAAPTALSLITISFPEGKERNRAFAVYAAVSGGGAAIGLLAGGILTEYLTWRWVLFVNVPIGVALMIGGYLYIHSSERLSGRFDLGGGLASVAGMVLLVYGFIHAARSGWGNGITVGSLVVGGALLIAFVFYETKTPIAMMPMRIFSNRSRSASYLVMLMFGAAMFGMFYFLTFFVQGVMGFSALKAGFAFLPFCFIIVIGSGVVSQILPRTGPKILITIGAVLATIALFLFATVTADTSYAKHLLPVMCLMALGMSFIFVPLTTTAVAKVETTDAGLASALLNVGQQVGGAIGLSVLATVAATAGRSAGKTEVAKITAQVKAGTVPNSTLQHFGELSSASQSGKIPTHEAAIDAVAKHAAAVVQAHSAATGFLTAAIFGVVAVIVAVVGINVKKSDLPTESLDPVAVA